MDEDIFDELLRFPLNFQETHMKHTLRQLEPEVFDDLMDKLLLFVGLIPESCTPLQKATLLYTVISKCVTPDFHVPKDPETKRALERQSYTYAGAVLNGTAVCNGVCQLYAKLCQACGIRCNIVEGYGKDPKEKNLHAWVQIWLPDETGQLCPANCDLTWDLEPSRSGPEFRYFLKSDSYMQANGHTWLPDMGKDKGIQKFTPCLKDWNNIPELPEEAINLMCKVFRGMKLPQKLVLPALN